ncbi:hypothetical protein HU200_000782 [Digitaria exilis]|uniref:Uncharacterized protein n=1 Tax=Digitaria exilis TaxID=1010633 RepID=A0A835KWP2_9POAL|nr:hypothetical protein HU200_000782 [Digitaria exilis]
MPGWIPRRLGMHPPIPYESYDKLKKLGIPPPPEGRYMTRYQDLLDLRSCHVYGQGIGYFILLTGINEITPLTPTTSGSTSTQAEEQQY